MSARIIVGDCREVLRGLADASVDSIVTDAPVARARIDYARRQGHQPDLIGDAA